MAQKEHDRRPEPLKPEEAAELQSDDVAPVDQKRCGWPKSSYVFARGRLGSVSKSGITGVPVFTPVSVDA
jgi:hypothetical protein